MKTQKVSVYLDSLRGRVLPDAGRGEPRGGEYRPDAAAWGILALTAHGTGPEILEPARSRLAKAQAADGRVPLSPDHPEAFWPTPLAVLAWLGSPGHREPAERAVRFLLATAGRHFAKEPGSMVAHDPSLRGWPWVADTHSMVEPTSLGVLALVAAGHGGHPRVKEAVRMLMDRQLPSGGWNYGNTIVYGQELHPQPENTGLALNALAGFVPLEEVRHSLGYLRSRVQEIRAPLSLGWAVLGLEAWGRSPEKARSWISECLERQEEVGPYDTPNLSLLLISLGAPQGLLSTSLGSAGPGR